MSDNLPTVRELLARWQAIGQYSRRLRNKHIAINAKSRELKGRAKRNGRHEILVRLAELEEKHAAAWADVVANKLKMRRLFFSIIVVRMKMRMVDLEIAVTRTAAGVWPVPQTKVPPKTACFLLDLFLAKADRDAIPGDLGEYFAADLSKYGAGRARLLFWTRTVGVIASRNPVCRWVLVSGLTRVFEWILRNLG